jgi:LPS export ABC transporter protein LptC
MKKIQFILIAIAFTTLILVIVALVRNSRPPDNSKHLANLPSRGVEMQLDNVHYEQINQHGFKEWELDALSAQFFRSENKIVLQSLTATFFSNEGKIYTLVAEKGELYTDSKNVKVSGNVVANTHEGYQIKTDSLQYSAQKRTITTNDKVALSGKDMVMTGRGMIVDLELEKLHILGEVKASEQK